MAICASCRVACCEAQLHDATTRRGATCCAMHAVMGCGRCAPAESEAGDSAVVTSGASMLRKRSTRIAPSAPHASQRLVETSVPP